MNNYESISLNREIFDTELPAHKQVFDFIVGGVSAYMMIRGVREVFGIDFENQVLASMMFTAMPYINDRIMQYSRRIWTSEPRTIPSDYIGIKSRVAGGVAAFGIGAILGSTGLFKPSRTFDSSVLASIGLLSGKSIEFGMDKMREVGGFSCAKNKNEEKIDINFNY